MFHKIINGIKREDHKKHAEHRRIMNEIEAIYPKLKAIIGPKEAKQIEAIREQHQNKISDIRKRLELEMNQQYSVEVDAVDLEYMKKELDLLQLLYNQA